jgi:hypothetical protein
MLTLDLYENVRKSALEKSLSRTCVFMGFEIFFSKSIFGDYFFGAFSKLFLQI